MLTGKRAVLGVGGDGTEEGERELFWIFMQSERGYWKGGVYREESGSFLRGNYRFMPGKVGVVIYVYNYASRGIFMHKQAKGS